MRLIGRARAMLTAERSALNTVQHLSGIATMIRGYVDAISGTGAIMLDTRKTIPGLRVMEKYATRMGRTQHHRRRQIGRASCRESVCQYVEISVVDVFFNKTTQTLQSQDLQQHN